MFSLPIFPSDPNSTLPGTIWYKFVDEILLFLFRHEIRHPFSPQKPPKIRYSLDAFLLSPLLTSFLVSVRSQVHSSVESSENIRRLTLNCYRVCSHDRHPLHLFTFLNARETFHMDRPKPLLTPSVPVLHNSYYGLVVILPPR